MDKCFAQNYVNILCIKHSFDMVSNFFASWLSEPKFDLELIGFLKWQ